MNVAANGKQSFFYAELQALEDAKKEFFEKFPNAEINLNTEMLLNGFARLTARIRQEMAETENRIAREFIEKVSPELLTPLPSKTLAEIIPSSSDNLMRDVPNGAMLFSKGKNANEKANVWHVLGNHKLNPMQKIISVRVVEDLDGFDCLEIEAEGMGEGGGKMSGSYANDEEIIIYINGESEFAWTLWYFLLKHSKNFSAKPFVVSHPQSPWELCRDFFTFEEQFRYIKTNAIPKKIRFDKKLPRDIFSKICTESLKLRVFPVVCNSQPNSLQNMQQNSFIAKQEIVNLETANFQVKDESLLMCSAIPLLKAAPFMQTPISSAIANRIFSASQQGEISSQQNGTSFSQGKNSERYFEWAVLMLLQKNAFGFFENDALANSLRMWMWSEQGKRNFFADCIQKTECEISNAVFKGCIVPQANIKITLLCENFNGNNYAFLGILNAFGNMLFYLFKQTMPCNLLIALILKIEPFGIEIPFGNISTLFKSESAAV